MTLIVFHEGNYKNISFKLLLSGGDRQILKLWKGKRRHYLGSKMYKE